MKEAVSKFIRELIFIQKGAPGKPLHKSKRFWCAILSLAAILIQTQTGLGWIADPETQMLILTGINFGVGLLTKSPTGFAWDEDNPEMPGRDEWLIASGRVTLTGAGPSDGAKMTGPWQPGA